MGYIDRTGKTIIKPQFDVAFDFIDGVAKVYFREKITSASGPVTRTGHGYIDKKGRLCGGPNNAMEVPAETSTREKRTY